MNVDSNFPAGVPIDASGRLTMQWRQFLMALFTRTGGTVGVDIAAVIDDLMAEDASGTPAPDMAAVYAMIHAVEAIAAQAMASVSRVPDERGEAGEGASVTILMQRVSDLEAKIDAISTPMITDTSQMSNGSKFLAAPNNLSDVASASSALTNLGVGAGNSPTFAGMTLTGPFSFAPTTTTTAPSAGGAGALPATPTGYATVTIGGTARKFAYY